MDQKERTEPFVRLRLYVEHQSREKRRESHQRVSQKIQIEEESEFAVIENSRCLGGQCFEAYGRQLREVNDDYDDGVYRGKKHRRIGCDALVGLRICRKSGEQEDEAQRDSDRRQVAPVQGVDRHTDRENCHADDV